MILIDVDALRKELDNTGDTVPSWVARRIDNAPTVCCEACEHGDGPHTDKAVCCFCFGASNFVRREP